MATALMGIVALGASTLLLGLTPPGLFPVALLAMLATGVTLPIANGSIQAALQSSIPPDLHGRIFTLVGSVSAAMVPLGLAVAGSLSDAVGVETWFIVGGIAASAIGGLSLCLPSVLGLEERGAELGRMRALRRAVGSGEPVVAPVPGSPEAGSGNA